MKQKLLILFLFIILILFSIPLVMKGKTFPINWQPKIINTAMHPASSQEFEVAFESNVNLKNVELWVVPELQSIIDFQPTNFTKITAGIKNIVNIKITIPYENNNVDVYEGTLHVGVAHKTYPMNLKIMIDVIPTTLAPFDSTKIVEDPELGTKIVSNRIVVFFKEGTTLDDIKEVVDSINGRIVGYVSRGDLFQIEIPDTDDASGVHVVLDKLKINSSVKFAAPSILPYWNVIPNDYQWTSPDTSLRWGQEFINLPGAWDITTGDPSVQIAIIEAGFDENHEDVTATVHKLTSPTDIDHGTHVTGIIGARGNNEIGVSGVSWNYGETGLEVYQVGGSFEYIYSAIMDASEKVDAIRDIKVTNLDAGADWLDMIFSEETKDEFENLRDIINGILEPAISYANDQGVLVITAAGNGDSEHNPINAQYDSPASLSLIYDNVIPVASIDSDGELSSFSNYGEVVTIAAPGEDIYSTVSDNGYDDKSGTSMAAPFVTGVAGLLYSKAEEMGISLSAKTVKDYILRGAQKGGKSVVGPDGHSIPILNAYESLNLLASPPAPSTLSYSDLTSNSVKLSWSQNQDPDFAFYRLNRTVTVNGQPQTTTVKETSVQSETSFTDTNLQSGIHYSYQLLTFDQAGLSSSSNEVEVVPINLPPTPVTLSYSDLTSTSIKLSWSKNEDPDFLFYVLVRIKFDGEPVVTPIFITEQESTSYPDTNLIPGTFYAYLVVVVDKAGLVSPESNIVFVTTLPPVFYIPQASITVDGNDSDWQGIPPAIVDPPNDEPEEWKDVLGADLTDVYFAYDDTFLYAKIDFPDGEAPNKDIIYFFTLDSNPVTFQIGDYFILFGFHYPSNDWVVTVRKITSLEPPESIIIFQKVTVKPGNNFLELKMPLFLLDKDEFNFYATARTVDNGDRTSKKELRLKPPIPELLPVPYIPQIPDIPFGQITIDGNSSDWQNVPVFVESPKEETYPPGLDLKTLYLVERGNRIYFLFEVWDNEVDKTGQVGYRLWFDNNRDGILNGDPGDRQVSVSFTGNTPYVWCQAMDGRPIYCYGEAATRGSFIEGSFDANMLGVETIFGLLSGIHSETPLAPDSFDRFPPLPKVHYSPGYTPVDPLDFSSMDIQIKNLFKQPTVEEIMSAFEEFLLQSPLPH